MNSVRLPHDASVGGGAAGAGLLVRKSAACAAPARPKSIATEIPSFFINAPAPTEFLENRPTIHSSSEFKRPILSLQCALQGGLTRHDWLARLAAAINVYFRKA